MERSRNNGESRKGSNLTVSWISLVSIPNIYAT